MPRPNILIFMPDQLRADCVGCFDNPGIQTPNIDALAARGMKFNNAWVNHPVCSPSRVSLMTGWYPHTRGHRTLTHLIQPHESNLLRYLKEGGYHVAWAGARGDVFAPGVTEQSTHFCGWTTPPVKRGMGPQFQEGSALYNVFHHGRRPGDGIWLDFDEAATLTAIDWLDTNPKGPWCLWIPLIFPHLPFEVEEPWYSLHARSDVHRRYAGHGSGKPRFHQAIRDRYGTERLTNDEWTELVRVYYGMIARVDSQLGRVMRALERSGNIEDTVTVFLTDHGEYAGDFGLVEKWPSGLDRCLLQNPLLIAGPGITEGTTAETFTEMVDILPTLLEIAEIKVRHTHFGKSLLPVLQDPGFRIRDRAFSEGGFSVRELDLLETARGEYANKARLQHEQPRIVGRAISMRTDRYTYVYRLYEEDELYDRSDDPDERHNLIRSPDRQLTAGELKNGILDWLVETADVIPWQSDPRFPEIPQGQHDTFHFPGITSSH